MRTAQTVVPITNAADVVLSASVFAHYVEIAEDGSGSAAGIQVTWPNGAVEKYTPAMQPIKIGTPEARQLVGAPSYQTGVTATQYCKVRSMGANTNVRIDEWC